jgi:two-component system nitrate/nitrite response regulator NarL
MTDAASHPIRILVADKQSILRAGLRNLLAREAGLEVVGEAPNLAEAIRLAVAAKADVLLADFESAHTVDVRAMASLASNHYAVYTILLAEPDEEKAAIANALRMGVWGIVWKDAGAKVLIQGIRSVVQGKIWLGKESIAHLDEALLVLGGVHGNPSRQKTFGLTRRELEIVAKIVSGYANREIARKLSISEDTVKHHITNIFDKVGVYNRLEMALFAIHHGLVKKKIRNSKFEIRNSRFEIRDSKFEIRDSKSKP